MTPHPSSTPTYRRRSSSAVRFNTVEDLPVVSRSTILQPNTTNQSLHGNFGGTGGRNGLSTSKTTPGRNGALIRPSTTGVRTRGEKRLMNMLDESHVNQQTMPLHLKEKQQISSLLPTGFISTADLNNLNEIKKHYRSLENDGRNGFDTLQMDSLNDQYRSSIQEEALASRSNQRLRVLEAFETIHDRFVNQNFHPQLKARHTDDLFQISHFLIKEHKQMIENMGNMQRDNALLKQKIRQYEQIHKSDHDLVVSQPSQDDLKRLKDSVKVLRKEIADYSQTHMKEIVENSTIDKSNSIETQDELSSWKDHEFVSLLQQKFELLEDFIIALKKKIHSLEQVDEDVKRLGQDFGNVANLLQENEQLRKDKHVLQWMIKRYDHDELLKIEHTRSTDVNFLQSLTFGLQRELEHCKEALRFYNYEENSALKLAVTLEDEPLRYMSHNFDEYSTLWGLKKALFNNIDQEELLNQSNITLHASQRSKSKEQSERRTIEILSQENEFLHEQVQRHTKELEETKNLLSLLESQYKGESFSRFELKEIEITARRMMEQLTKVNALTTKRENTFISQQKLIEQLNGDRLKKEAEISSLSQRLLESHIRQKKVCSKLKASHNTNRTLCTLATSLIHLYTEDENIRKRLFGSTHILKKSEFDEEKLVAFLYRDLFHVFIQNTEAAVRIQSLWRGFQARRNLLKQGYYNIIIKKPNFERKTSNCTSNILDPLIKQKVSILPEVLDSSHRMRLTLNTEVNRNINRSLQTTRLLQEVILITDSDTSKLKELQSQLKIIRGLLMHEFKQQIQEQMNQFSEYFQITSTQLYTTIQNLATIPKHCRSVQTEEVEMKNKPTQVGEAQFSNAVVKSFHESLSSANDPKKKK